MPRTSSTNSLRTRLATSVACAGLGLVDDDLRQAVAVAQVDEDEPAVVAAAMHPAGDPDLAPGVVAAQLAARDVAIRRRQAEGGFGRDGGLAGLTHAANASGQLWTPTRATSHRVADLDDVAIGIVESEDSLTPFLDFDWMYDVGARVADGDVGSLEVVRLEVDIEVVLALRP